MYVGHWKLAFRVTKLNCSHPVAIVVSTSFIFVGVASLSSHQLCNNVACLQPAFLHQTVVVVEARAIMDDNAVKKTIRSKAFLCCVQ